MRNNFEVVATTDKAKRDEIFDQLRASTLPNERQAVKWSGAQEAEDGSWVSLWMVAYPIELEDL
jgi:hypothetical protein